MHRCIACDMTGPDRYPARTEHPDTGTGYLPRRAHKRHHPSKKE
ncbi:hypothetical protein [Vogesella fluminis]|nr:hypothetical protein [Vogesella fluminis]